MRNRKRLGLRQLRRQRRLPHFPRFSKGSTEIWIGGSSFRHNKSPSGAGALADKVPAGHSFPFVEGAPGNPVERLRVLPSLARNPSASAGSYLWRVGGQRLTPQQVQQNGQSAISRNCS